MTLFVATIPELPSAAPGFLIPAHRSLRLKLFSKHPFVNGYLKPEMYLGFCATLRNPARPCATLHDPAQPFATLRDPAQPCTTLRDSARPCTTPRDHAQTCTNPMQPCANQVHHSNTRLHGEGPGEGPGEGKACTRAQTRRTAEHQNLDCFKENTDLDPTNNQNDIKLSER